MTNPDAVDVIARAATELTIARRADMDRWVHLSLCVPREWSEIAGTRHV
jgi:hypothetical protein